MDLERIKKHLNIDVSFVDDDVYLMELYNVSKTIVEKHTCTTFNDDEIPHPLQQAILLLIGNYYANRESIAFASAGEIPLTYTYILDLYKNYNN